LTVPTPRGCSDMRSVSTWAVGFALALVVVGTAVLPLTSPGFTRALSGRFSLAAEAGLPPERMLEVAEQVRAFVVTSEADTLPETVDGRSGFDAGAVSHLIDVRRVLSAARLLTGLLTALVTIWIAIELARKRPERIADALRAGAILAVAFVVLAAAAAVLDFERFFTAFHGVFFRSGTWTFAFDSLLIQTFPEPFWVSCGAAWAALTVLGAGALLGLARLLTAPQGARPAGPDGG